MCSDEMGVDIFFIFVKLTSLEGGIQLLVEYCPSLVYLSLRALEKTHNDVVRTNSLGTLSSPADLYVDSCDFDVPDVHLMEASAYSCNVGPSDFLISISVVMTDLLIALAQVSVFNISISTTAFDGQRDTSDQDMTAPPGQTGASFVGQFAEAMKASLLSTDTQVQIRSLVLIDQVCPTSLDIGEELHSLVKEGLTDYIFEVLRVSGMQLAMHLSSILHHRPVKEVS